MISVLSIVQFKCSTRLKHAPHWITIYTQFRTKLLVFETIYFTYKISCKNTSYNVTKYFMFNIKFINANYKNIYLC